MNKKVVTNASWIIGCKIVQSILALVVSMLTARYLGPSNYGLINYAQSICTFAIPIMQLGFNWVLVREIIEHPDEENKILGSCISLSFVSAITCILGIFCFVSFANASEEVTIIICLLYSVNLIFQAFELIQYWFQAKYLAKYTSLISFFSYLLVSGYKVYLLIASKSVYWFVISYALDYFIISVCLFVFYKKLTGKKLSFSWIVSKRLLNNGKYYILSGLMITIFLQTDRVMLKLMNGNVETGFYSAAANCIGMAAFIFAAINDSMRTFVLENKKAGREKFESSIIKLYSFVFYSALLYGVLLAAFSPVIIRILYGEDYLSAIPVLRVLAIYAIFSYYGGAKDIWILAEGKQKYLLIINVVGAVSNIVLNYCLIPISGATGAAIASFVTQFITNIVMVSVIAPLRRNNILLYKSLNPLIIKRTIIGMIRHTRDR